MPVALHILQPNIVRREIFVPKEEGNWNGSVKFASQKAVFSMENFSVRIFSSHVHFDVGNFVQRRLWCFKYKLRQSHINSQQSFWNKVLWSKKKSPYIRFLSKFDNPVSLVTEKSYFSLTCKLNLAVFSYLLKFPHCVNVNLNQKV